MEFVDLYLIHFRVAEHQKSRRALEALQVKLVRRVKVPEKTMR